MNKLLGLIALTLMLLATTGSHASTAPCRADGDRPSVGLVLSGGGARGAAHVGAIKVLEELRIPVDCIAGTSMGAIVGGLYASGLSAAELEDILYGLDWVDALQDSPSRRNRSFRRKQDDVNFLINFDVGFRNGKLRLPKGLVHGQKLNALLRGFVAPVEGISEFDALPIPFRSVATDVETGEMVVLDRGDLVSAIKASMSAPGVFAPVDIEDRLLIDGGVANNLPVDVAREMGADVLIVVDIGFPLLEREQLDSALALTNQMLTILIRRKAEQQLASLNATDIAILPDLGDIGSTDFHRSAEAVPLGEQAARDEYRALTALTVDEAHFLAHQAARQTRRDFSTRTVRNLTIEDNSQWSDKVLEGNLTLKPDEDLQVDVVREDVSRLYGLDTFELVDYHVEHVDEALADITIKTSKKSWGPNFINFGINLIDDFDGSSGYNLAARYTKTQVNPLGAEWRTDLQVGDNPLLESEFYQPLNYASRYFVAPRVRVEKRSVSTFNDDGSEQASLSLTFSQLQLDVGRTFGQNAEFRVGFNRSSGRLSPRIGSSGELDSLRFEGGAFSLGWRYDSRDNVRFTRQGIESSIEWVGFREGLGDTSDNDRVSFEFLNAMSRGPHTVLTALNAGSNLNGDGEIEDLFGLGGLFSLSGYQLNELRGQHYALMALAYYRRVGLGSSTFQTPLYIGASFEAGNVWDDSDDISINGLRLAGSLFIGLDTFIGPLYLSHGFAENGRSATYFQLGTTF
ncbi:MAG: patatin-like phospholipase family protein [Pseudomonadota bacterium]